MSISRAFDGSAVPTQLPTQACGGTPIFDADSGMSYRCDVCFAVIGSIGQPRTCKELNAQSKQPLGPRPAQ